MGQRVMPTTHTGITADHGKQLRRLRVPVASSALLAVSQQSGSHTLSLADGETCVEFTGSSASNCTIPPNSSVGFPIGAWVQIRQYGTGQVTMVAGSGVTLRSPASAVKTCQQFTTLVAHQRATDEWVITGDLV